jgi:hypothetical protein
LRGSGHHDLESLGDVGHSGCHVHHVAVQLLGFVQHCTDVQTGVHR